jgi:glyoxylase-like metal-dependent hydrolase (beta-lactamase superfamily II)
MELGPQLRRIGNDIVAAYLIVTDDGITVIDAGLAGLWKDLLAELEAIGRPLSDIRGLVVTHGDSDHVGFAERLHRETGAPVYVHEADAERARGHIKSKAGGGKMKLGATLGFFAYALRKGGMRTTWLTELVEIHDGDALDLPGAPRIISMPGHSPGSVAVYSTVADAVFVGDALTTRNVLTGAAGAAPAPFTDDPEAALASLDRIAGLDASWVLPGHGTPWHGSPASIVEAVRAAAA